MSDPRQDELHWLAFCYVAGELKPEAAEAFEERLAVDSDARDALVSAVGLTQMSALAIENASASESSLIGVSSAAAGATPARTEAAAWRGRARGIGAGVVAGALLTCLAVAVWGPVSEPGETQSPRVDGRGPRDGELAMAWVRSREELNPLSAVGPAAAGEDAVDGDDRGAGEVAMIFDDETDADDRRDAEAEGLAGIGAGPPWSSLALELEAPSWMLFAVASGDGAEAGGARDVE